MTPFGTPASGPAAIFYFSSRDICDDFRDYDFRYPLVEAWRRRGVATHYIRLKRRPDVSAAFSSERLIGISLRQLPGFIRSALQDAGAARPVYFNSTCLNFPLSLAALRLLLPAGLWCYDLHDDYAYRASGWRKQSRRLQQRVLARTADLTVRTATTLQELVPASRALANASDIVAIPRPALGFSRILVIGSIDERYDFALLDRVARLAPDLQIDLWGQVSQNRREPQGQLQSVLLAHPNVRHFGRYGRGELAAILARYDVALAPYRTGVALTRYLDPLRYYDCLNSGMELIATDIPTNPPFTGVLHVATSAEEIVEICRRLARDGSARRNRADLYRPITWDDRAGEFLEICRRSMAHRPR